MMKVVFGDMFYIYLNTKQIHGIKVLKIGSIIVPLPALDEALPSGAPFSFQGAFVMPGCDRASCG